MWKAGWISLLMIHVWSLSVHALQPPTPDQVLKYKRDGTWEQKLQNAYSIGNHRPDPDLILKTRNKLQSLLYRSQGLSDSEILTMQALPPARQGMPTTGNVKMFVLCIEFTDYPHISPVDDITNLTRAVFGEENPYNIYYPYESLSAYYTRSSYDLLNLSGPVMGWYDAGISRSAIEQTTAGRENLIKEAIHRFDSSGLDFSQFDNDNDGYIDYFAVIWTGPPGAWSSFWWGYQTQFMDSSFSVDGKRLGKYSWQWESYDYPAGSFTPQVLIHETGHALGLPDYYDYDDSIGPRGGVGGLDMMDSNVGDHNSFSKFTLDWLVPQVISVPGSYPGRTLLPSPLSADALLVMPGASGNPYEEFFMVQYRSRQGNDTRIPEDGLLIWHVNAALNSLQSDYLYNNSYTPYKLLRLMEADGLEEIETSAAMADAEDFYTPGCRFTPDTIPDSNTCSGVPTGIGITQISSLTDSITCDVSIGGTGQVSYFPWSLYLPAILHGGSR